MDFAALRAQQLDGEILQYAVDPRHHDKCAQWPLWGLLRERTAAAGITMRWLFYRQIARICCIRNLSHYVDNDGDIIPKSFLTGIIQREHLSLIRELGKMIDLAADENITIARSCLTMIEAGNPMLLRALRLATQKWNPEFSMNEWVFMAGQAGVVLANIIYSGFVTHNVECLRELCRWHVQIHRVDYMRNTDHGDVVTTCDKNPALRKYFQKLHTDWVDFWCAPRFLYGA